MPANETRPSERMLSELERMRATPGATQEPRSEGGERTCTACGQTYRWLAMHAEDCALRATPSVQPPASLDPETLQRAKDAIEWIVPQYRNTLAGRGVRNVYETFVECEFALKAIARALATGETPRCSLHSTFQAFCPQCERETKCLDALDGETPEVGREPEEPGEWWRCPRCESVLGWGLDVCCGMLLDEEDGGDTRHAPVFKPGMSIEDAARALSAPVERQESEPRYTTLADVGFNAEPRERELIDGHDPGCPAVADDESDQVLTDFQECPCEPREREGEGLEEQPWYPGTLEAALYAFREEALKYGADLNDSAQYRAMGDAHRKVKDGIIWLWTERRRLLSSAPQGDRERQARDAFNEGFNLGWQTRMRVFVGMDYMEEQRAAWEESDARRALAPSVPSQPGLHHAPDATHKSEGDASVPSKEEPR